MELYRFTSDRGKHLIKKDDGTYHRISKGDTIELTDSQARSFADKFTRIRGAAPAPSQPDPEPEVSNTEGEEGAETSE